MSKTGQATASRSMRATLSIAHRIAHCVETGRGDRIPPDVMRPGDACLRRHRELEPGQPQLAALARAQHQPVRAERDRAAVAVCCLVMDA